MITHERRIRVKSWRINFSRVERDVSGAKVEYVSQERCEK